MYNTNKDNYINGLIPIASSKDWEDLIPYESKIYSSDSYTKESFVIFVAKLYITEFKCYAITFMDPIKKSLHISYTTKGWYFYEVKMRNFIDSSIKTYIEYKCKCKNERCLTKEHFDSGCFTYKKDSLNIARFGIKQHLKNPFLLN